MFNPNADPDSPGGSRPPATGGSPQSDSECPWCGSNDLLAVRRMPSWRGAGILIYIVFPIAFLYWLTTPTYIHCRACGGRWQRGVRVAPRPRSSEEPEIPAPAERAGMYGTQVPAPAVVRRRQRLGAVTETRPVGDVEIKAPPGSCRTCRAAAGRYSAENAPTLPLVGCTCEGGCRCEVVASE